MYNGLTNERKGGFFVVTPVVIANNFIYRAMRENKNLTPLKLQKLIYFLYKEYLKETGIELFGERFETWKYGPVVPSVYYEFASFGKDSITKFARDSKDIVQLVKEEGRFKTILDNVWIRYCNYSGEELSSMTHCEGGAWKKACERQSRYLEVGDIQNEPIL